jgi:hypothetical protein
MWYRTAMGRPSGSAGLKICFAQRESETNSGGTANHSLLFVGSADKD